MSVRWRCGGAAMVLLALGAAASAACAQVLHVDSERVESQPVEAPGFPEGMHVRRLHRTEAGGGASRVRVEAGFVEPEHYHTTSAHSIYVLSGRVTFAGVSAGPGHFFHTPVGVPHALVAETDAEVLIWADGPLDFHPGTPPD